MNDRGLAVSLTFGGLPGTGDGFAIPLVVRYLLEVCDTVDEARRVIDRIPVAASYNLTMTDRSGRGGHGIRGAGRVPEYFDMPLATNHRGLVPDRPDLARRFRSVERQDVLRGLDREGRAADAAAETFLSPCLAKHRLRGRLRHALHGGLPAGRRGGHLPLARCDLASNLRVIGRRDPRASSLVHAVDSSLVPASLQ